MHHWKVLSPSDGRAVHRRLLDLRHVRRRVEFLFALNNLNSITAADTIFYRIRYAAVSDGLASLASAFR